jgi:hypothetical protein
LISFANGGGTTPGAIVEVYLVEQCEELVPRIWCSEQNQADPITIGKQRSFHLPMENNQLLAEQRIFYNQIGSATSEI